MDHLVFTGGYTEAIHLSSGETVPGRCRGISAYRLHDGALSFLCCSPVAVNPSYLTVDAAGETLYCVSECSDFHGMPSSTVSACRINRASGELTLLGSQLTCGEDACYAAVCPDGRWLFVTNYTGGSVVVLPILPDHRLGSMSCLLRHSGSGANPARQSSPHPHQVVFSPDGRFVYVSDLGLDQLVCYCFDRERGWLLPAPARDIAVPAGQGARHFVFGKNGDLLYLMTEMACCVDVFRFDPDTGRTELLQTLSCLQKNAPPSLGAAIRLSPDGRLLFCSVRGSDVIAAFRIRPDGTLSSALLQPSGGQIPRDFNLTPDGRFLLAGHQDSDTLICCAVDPDAGLLRPISSLPSPCTTVVGIC
jgi:6-phosphogluconolactonase